MNKIELFKILSVVCLIAILFTPADSTAWAYLLILAAVFGISWLK